MPISYVYKVWHIFILYHVGIDFGKSSDILYCFLALKKKPLTLEQQNAAIMNSKYNLVVAGAGTGKTAAIIGKIAFLLKEKKCMPQNILVLAYNESIKREIKKRIDNRLGLLQKEKCLKIFSPLLDNYNLRNISVHTFHSLGCEILKKTKSPTLFQ